MSCEKCGWVQLDFDSDVHPPAIYVRVDAANVQVVACDIHTRRLIELLRKGIEAESQPR